MEDEGSSRTAPAFIITLGIIIAVILLGAAYYLGVKNRNNIQSTLLPTPTMHKSAKVSPSPSASPSSMLANPASENCLKMGGKLSIQKRGDGGQYGVCELGDGYSCEEWALMRGECPKGGVRTTGFDTKQQIYCAILGGKTLAVPNATCTFADGSVCTDDDLWNGLCQKGATK